MTCPRVTGTAVLLLTDTQCDATVKSEKGKCILEKEIVKLASFVFAEIVHQTLNVLKENGQFSYSCNLPLPPIHSLYPLEPRDIFYLL